jgi:ADP-heptose:LPS heptosyltransferase
LQEIKKILFLAEGQIGDSICLTPAIRAVKESLPNSHTTILLFHRRKYIGSDSQGNPYIETSNFEGTSEVFKGNPFVDEVLELDRKAMRALSGFKRVKAEYNCVKYLRRQKYDAVICTFPQNRFVIWSFFAGIKKRIGEKGQQFETLLTGRPKIKRSDSGVLNYFCDLLKPLGITAKDKNTFYSIPGKFEDDAKNKLKELNISAEKKLLIIHPGASDKDRQLPVRKMADLINMISGKKDIEVLITYSEYDEEYITELKVLLPEKLKCVKTEKIAELAGFLKLSDAALVHNSGPRHLAAAIGTKTIGLLEKYDDIMWKIYEDDTRHAIVQSKKDCVTCNGGKCFGFIPKGEKFGANCMHDIETEDVFRTVERVINNP